VPLLLLTAAGYAWSWTLKRQVTHKTRNLANELEHSNRLQNEVQYRAEHDVVTHLPNRRAFIDQLEKRITAEPDWKPRLIAIRIENMEKLATTFGYTVTEELAYAFGQRLKKLGFPGIGYLAGGIYVAIPRASMEPEEMISLVTELINLNTIDVDPQITVGTVKEVQTEGDPTMASELVRRAAIALLTAQEKRLPYVTYDPSLEPDPDDLLLLHDFRRYGTDNMFLHYQPKVDLKSGRIRSVEALIRWQHPTLGLVSPARFIPLLEQSGLITQITRWVIAETVRMALRLGTSVPDYSVSVNITAQDLLEPDLLNFIIDAIRPLEAQRLWVEITETGFIEDPTYAREVLSDLRAAGVPCAVDDFGTGYSSLYYLSAFPVDDVKLDRMFITDMLDNERHRVIVRSTIALAHELGLTVTTEGVEDEATLKALIDLGCDAIQGFVVSPPVSENEMSDLIGQEMYSVIEKTAYNRGDT
jgi:EAL domain-containing protein (putative c-di-GMP-specific phosphodiesterase class I)